jgi:retron-type reverse transcriptase
MNTCAYSAGIKDGYGYAVDIDLSKFFDKVDHDLLMNRLGKWVTDKQLLALIGKYLLRSPGHFNQLPADLFQTIAITAC